MNQFIRRLVVEGLYGRFDIDASFSDGVNIIHGINGTGKTTLLHILANAANLDLPLFSQLMFKTIRLEVENGVTIEFKGEPLAARRVVSQATLQIDGEEIATWPSTEHQGDEDHHRARYAGLDIIRERRKHRDIAIEATYFPAFRTMIEAWSSLDLTESPSRGQWARRPGVAPPYSPPPHRLRPGWRARRSVREAEAQTRLARDVFGGFVPWIDYPSPREIQRDLDFAIQRAVNRVAGGDRSLLSGTFNRVFEAISQETAREKLDPRTPEAIRSNISDQLEQIETIQKEYGLLDSNTAFDELRSQLASSGHAGRGKDDTTMRVLLVYEDALSQRVKGLNDSFSTVREYIVAVNDFLNGKQLVIGSAQEVDSTPRLQIRHDDGTLSELDTLSSGERQIAGLIYSASHIARGSVVLVDEPELSLHIDWQRAIIGSMVRQLPQKQLIVCTHSPMIARRYEDRMIELVPRATSSSSRIVLQEDDYDGDWHSLEYSEDDM